MRVIVFFVAIVLALSVSSCLNTDSYDYAGQFTADTTAIRNYINNYSINAVKLSSGVWYEIDHLGSGYYPSYADTITVDYTGSKLDGSNFDTKTGFQFGLASVFSGWQIGIPKFPVGTTGKIYLPSYFAYGNVGSTTPKVDPNTVVIYQITVTKVSGYQLLQDVKAIDKYISDNSITNVIGDASGLRYRIDTVGNGSMPLPTSRVVATFSLKILNANGTTTSLTGSSTPTTYYLPDQILGWGIGIPKMQEGSTATFFVPSGLAYSIFPPSTSIPVKANLIYQIRMTKVLP